MLKRILSLVLVAWLASGCSGESSSGDADSMTNAPMPADLVLLHGTIATGDDALGTVEALAVNGYTITALGTSEDMSRYVGPQTQVVELQGRFVMPGFIEGHGHYMALGRAKQILDLSTVKNWAEAVDMVAAAVDKAKPGEWIFGRGWHQEKWDSVPDDAIDGVPRNDSLSKVSPDNPVLLGHASGHAAFANDAALAAGGVDDDTPDPAGGTIVRAANGKATGMLREAAQRLINEAVQRYNGRLTPQQEDRVNRERAMLAGSEALSHGITAFVDAGVPFETIDFYKKLEGEGRLPVRMYAMVRYETVEDMDRMLPHYKMLPEGNDYLTVRSIKRQVDGALGSHGAWLLKPYVDMPDNTGLVLDPLDEIAATAAVAVKHGFQLNTHAIGDRANREMLDLYERVWKEQGVDGKELRWRIEHAQHLDPADVPRFAELGVIAAMQGIHCTSDGPWIHTRLGEERTRLTSYRWRDLIDSGAIIANGTDVPVEHIDPIASYYASVSRMMANGKRFYPQQAMTREEAFASYTSNNAYAAFLEDEMGTLTPGKYADITVLSKDILTVDEAKIPDTEVEMTFVGGQLKYSHDQGVIDEGQTQLVTVSEEPMNY